MEEAAGEDGGGRRAWRRRPASMEEDAAGKDGGGRQALPRLGRRSSHPPSGVGGVVTREKVEEGARLHLRRRRLHLPNSSAAVRTTSSAAVHTPKVNVTVPDRVAPPPLAPDRGSSAAGQPGSASWQGSPAVDLLLRAQGRRGSPPPQGLEAAVGARHHRGRRSPPPPGPAAVGEAARGEGGDR
jgi:hypothetical protein